MTDSETDVDAATLQSYLSEALDEEVLETEVLDEALNVNVGISTRDGAWAYVLRRPDKLRHTDLFNDLRREYGLLERLRDTAVPTPDPVLFCDDASVVGDPFFVTTYLDGEAIPMGSPLVDRFPTERARRSVAGGLVDALAEIHSLDADPFADVCERLTPREQVDRAVERLDRARSVTGRDLRGLREVAAWLRDRAPPDPETALVHGDFKPGNLLFSGGERPEVTGVLDWEAALLGDPRTELGYLLLYWRDDGDPTPSIDAIETRYPDEDALQWVRDVDENGFYPFTTLPGSPDRRDLVARYEERTGLSFENDRFYRAHAALMLATVWEDLHRHRLEAGEESDYEPLVDYASLLAEGIVGGEFPL